MTVIKHLTPSPMYSGWMQCTKNTIWMKSNILQVCFPLLSDYFGWGWVRFSIAWFYLLIQSMKNRLWLFWVCADASYIISVELHSDCCWKTAAVFSLCRCLLFVLNSQTIMAALCEPDLGTRTLAVPHRKSHHFVPRNKRNTARFQHKQRNLFFRSIEEWPKISSMDSVQSIELYTKYTTGI